MPPPEHARTPSAERHSAGKNAPPAGAPFFMEQGQAGVSFSFRSPPRPAMPITAQNRQVCHIFPKYYNQCYIHLAILQLCYKRRKAVDGFGTGCYYLSCNGGIPCGVPAGGPAAIPRRKGTAYPGGTSYCHIRVDLVRLGLSNKGITGNGDSKKHIRIGGKPT